METPLMQAASYGHENNVAYLLKKGAQVNYADHQGATALYCAARRGNARIVTDLLQAGATINAMASGKSTPLWVVLRIIRMR